MSVKITFKIVFEMETKPASDGSSNFQRYSELKVRLSLVMGKDPIIISESGDIYLSRDKGCQTSFV